MSLMRNRERFAKWLQNEMSNRDWTQSDLARHSGLHRAIISKLVLGASTPQPDTLLAIASALKLPETQVFEAAGILPQDSNTNPWASKMAHLLDMLNPENQEMALRLLETMVEQERAKNNDKKTQKISEAKKIKNGKTA